MATNGSVLTSEEHEFGKWTKDFEKLMGEEHEREKVGWCGFGAPGRAV